MQSHAPVTSGSFSTVPRDVLLLIMLMLSKSDVLTMRLVCRFFGITSTDKQLQHHYANYLNYNPKLVSLDFVTLGTQDRLTLSPLPVSFLQPRTNTRLAVGTSPGDDTYSYISFADSVSTGTYKHITLNSLPITIHHHRGCPPIFLDEQTIVCVSADRTCLHIYQINHHSEGPIATINVNNELSIPNVREALIKQAILLNDDVIAVSLLDSRCIALYQINKTNYEYLTSFITSKGKSKLIAAIADHHLVTQHTHGIEVWNAADSKHPHIVFALASDLKTYYLSELFYDVIAKNKLLLRGNTHLMHGESSKFLSVLEFTKDGHYKTFHLAENLISAFEKNDFHFNPLNRHLFYLGHFNQLFCWDLSQHTPNRLIRPTAYRLVHNDAGKLSYLTITALRAVKQLLFVSHESLFRRKDPNELSIVNLNEIQNTFTLYAYPLNTGGLDHYCSRSANKNKIAMLKDGRIAMPAMNQLTRNSSLLFFNFPRKEMVALPAIRPQDKLRIG